MIVGFQNAKFEQKQCFKISNLGAKFQLRLKRFWSSSLSLDIITSNCNFNCNEFVFAFSGSAFISALNQILLTNYNIFCCPWPDT